MEIKPIFLVLADISGYTQFIKQHTQAILHAEAIITELLEAVIDQAEFPLTLSKLEGDAALLYAVAEGNNVAAAQDITRQVLAFFAAFRAREQKLIHCDAGCVCDACRNIEQLKLKAILHHGQALFKRIRQFEELAGEDVILVHRLLKNTIPAKEYVAMTTAFHALSGDAPGLEGHAHTETYPDFGELPVRVFYPATTLAVTSVSATPAEQAAWGNKLGGYAFQRLIGAKPRPILGHIDNSRLNFGEWLVEGVATAVNLIRKRAAK